MVSSSLRLTKYAFCFFNEKTKILGMVRDESYSADGMTACRDNEKKKIH
jgi:hypothetical protein